MDVLLAKLWWLLFLMTFEHGGHCIQRDSSDIQNSPTIPSSFWDLYKNIDLRSRNFGAYERDSPKAWRYLPDNSPIKMVEINPDTEKKIYSILNLAARPKISHGPRRRRSSVTEDDLEKVKDLKDKLDKVPLYCWKVLINCKRFPSHVCCPVMPDFMRNSSDRSSREIKYVDPLFGIPIEVPAKGNRIPEALQKRRWASADPQSGCRHVDCNEHPQNVCCRGYQIDRMLPIGPYVQPSLVENWVSALFELFGRSPLSFQMAKEAFALCIILIGFVIWTWLGMELGFVKLPWQGKTDIDKKDEEVEEITPRVSFAIDEHNKAKWLSKVTKKLRSEKAFDQFLCCFVSPDDEKTSGKMECFAKSKKKYIYRSKLACVSNLLYDITLNIPDQEEMTKRI